MTEARQYKKPFWVLEYELKKLRFRLEETCYDAETLKEALDTGVNSVYLIENHNFFNRTNVGYLDEDGSYVFNTSETEKLDLNLPVEFCELDTDDDGYTIAIYNIKKGDN